jgi:SAM-dependent methyltransferase
VRLPQAFRRAWRAGGDFVICPQDVDSSSFSTDPGAAEVVCQHGTMKAVRVARLPQSAKAPLRCFDRILLVLDADPVAREEQVADFYDLLAPAYELVFTPARNLENIGRLLAIVRRRLGVPAAPVVDFGCGVGLSVHAEVPRGIELVGVDASPLMRQLAREAGLPTMAEHDLAAIPGGYFGGVIASYVLDLAPWPALLENVWRRMRPGGLIVANFHKRRGLSAFVDRCDQLSASTCVVDDVPPASFDHGPVVACIKPDGPRARRSPRGWS